MVVVSQLYAVFPKQLAYFFKFLYRFIKLAVVVVFNAVPRDSRVFYAEGLYVIHGFLSFFKEQIGSLVNGRADKSYIFKQRLDFLCAFSVISCEFNVIVAHFLDGSERALKVFFHVASYGIKLQTYFKLFHILFLLYFRNLYFYFFSGFGGLYYTVYDSLVVYDLRRGNGGLAAGLYRV